MPVVCGPSGPGIGKPSLSQAAGGLGLGGRIAKTNCEIARLALNAFAASLLPSRPSLPS